MDAKLEARALTVLDELLEQPERTRGAALDRLCGDDPSLRDRVTRLLGMSQSASLHTGAAHLLATDDDHPHQIGAYRITGLIGQGGMGAVYRGERAAGDFEHVAAIKLIRPGALSDTLIDRFRRERQTLARLSHPHIARLFDGGETEAGQPYLVMEYVDGRPLDAWLDEDRPSRADRLDLFLKVCAAVAYAHRNLIIHRDLTPANILVDRADQPKLIDFGIARPTNEAGGDLPHQTATPGFAPPERTAGAPATTLTDIFALGRLLDRLAGEGAAPDLRAIIDRASAADPTLRYPTAEALIDDIERFRDGRAVDARGGGAGYRFRRFVGRNRLSVAAAAAALLVLVGALVVTLVANRRAEIARGEAERRFAQTRAIAKTMLFDALDEVRKSPGGSQAQLLLARTGLHYLDALAADATAPYDVRLEVGRGYVRLAQLVGGGEGTQLGKLADGNRLLARGEQILGAARAERPRDAGARRAWAELRLEQAGANLAANNKPDLALAQAREAERLVSPAEDQALFAQAISTQGDAQGWADRYADALPLHRKAEAYIAALPSAARTSPALIAIRAANLRLLGEAYHRLKRPAEAQRTLDAAVAINRQRLAASPGDAQAVNKLIRALWYRGVVHRTNMRDPLAAASIGEALALSRRLAEQDRNDANALRLFALVGEVQAQIYADSGRGDASRAMTEESLAAHRRLVSLAGDPAGARRSMAQALRTGGGNMYNVKRYAAACQQWRQALDIFEDADRRGELLERDRINSMAEMRRFIAAACNPPRPGLGDEV
jgi:serine/threonine-protein kinase